MQDHASRLQSISDGTHTATYSYLPNSSLLQQTVLKQGTQTRLTTTRQYDNLNRLTQIASTPSGASVVSHAYEFNDANQRTKVTLADGSYWEYGYDLKGQVISAVKKFANGTAIPGMTYQYEFDDIGNRVSSKSGILNVESGIQPTAYAANPLNQYTERTVPGVVNVSGSASTNAVVSVGWGATTNRWLAVRSGEWFWKALEGDNQSGVLYDEVTVKALQDTGGGTGLVANKSGYAFVPKTPETFTHDANGNLTGDGRWTYTWDAENRLTSMTLIGIPTSGSSAPSAGTPAAVILAKTPNAPVKMEFGYDAQSRRISKKVYTWNSSTLNAQLSTHNVFLYDGWNCVAEIDGSSNLPKRTYLWGLDIGEMGGTRSPSASPGAAAGGVGGQLAQTYYNDQGQAIATMLPVYDGNGNITALVSATDGAVTAQYEYSPFGETIKETGPLAKANHFKFSTKPEDRESGFYNYGYRFYNAQTGRWISPDPMGEEGGLNLYGFVQNDGVNGIDFLGLAEIGNLHIGDINVVAMATTSPPPKIKEKTDLEKLAQLFNDCACDGGMKYQTQGIQTKISSRANPFALFATLFDKGPAYFEIPVQSPEKFKKFIWDFTWSEAAAYDVGNGGLHRNNGDPNTEFVDAETKIDLVNGSAKTGIIYDRPRDNKGQFANSEPPNITNLRGIGLNRPTTASIRSAARMDAATSYNNVVVAGLGAATFRYSISVDGCTWYMSKLSGAPGKGVGTREDVKNSIDASVQIKALFLYHNVPLPRGFK